MKSRQILTTLALTVLSFTVTFAVLWRQRAPRPAAFAPVPGRSLWTAASTKQSPRPIGAGAVVDASQSIPVNSAPAPVPAPAVEVPSSDDAGPPLPVMLAVTSHPSRPLDDPDDADGGDDGAPTVQPGVARQVDLLNESGDLLSITVLAVNVPTQDTTRADLLLPPHAQVHAGSESGLKLGPGYQVTLRSRGYQQMTETVP